MNTENQFKEGQEVWVKARIRSGIVFSDNTIAIRIRTANQDHFLYYCLCSEIRTTEQIWKDVITNDSKSDKFRVYIDDVRQGLNYYYIYAPDGTEAVLPKDCYSPREVIDICDRENAKIASQNTEPTTISKRETVTETPHFTPETPHNAELPDRTRRFRKGDKVQRRKELYGRPLNRWEHEIPFDVIYEVLEDEDPLNNHKVKIEHDRKTYFVSFAYFDLVEPAPEPKYWLHESPKTYSIYYKGQFGRVITAMLMQKDLYTLEEAQQECNKLNEK